MEEGNDNNNNNNNNNNNEDNNNNNASSSSSSSSSSNQQQQPQQRWTCDACGCNTNQQADRSCTICGTSNSGHSSLLRRAGAGYAAAARAGWLARGLASSGGRGPGGGGRHDSISRSVQEELGLEVDDDDDDDEELWESVVAESAAAAERNIELHDDESPIGGGPPHPHGVVLPESAIESLGAMGSSMARRMAAAENSRQRFLQAARAFTQQAAVNNEAAAAAAASRVQQQAAAAQINPTDLLRTATIHSTDYQPRWVQRPSQLATGSTGEGGGHSSSTTTTRSAAAKNIAQLVVGGQQGNVAHLPAAGSGEGFSIRAETPIPRGVSGATAAAAAAAAAAAGSTVAGLPAADAFAISLAALNNPNNNAAAAAAARGTRRNVYGFRVAFSHPTCEAGGNMGGCYLVGVTTSSFTHYGEPNGLQQTPFFWGIEDSGRKYEGSRRGSTSSSSSRSSSRRTSSSSGGSTAPSPFATDIGPRDAPFNSANVLFGSEEVVTVVCDLDSRTMTFWRDDTLLGTLVTTLPRGSNLFPVAVPFNRGSSVAITGLDSNPLPLLRNFAVEWRQAQKEKEEQQRRKLVKERAVVVKHGKVTPKLRSVLTSIFVQYSCRCPPDADATAVYLLFSEAARLWYRCGLKLSSLQTVLKDRPDNAKHVYLKDFFAVVEGVLEEDERISPPSPIDLIDPSLQVGDKVELIEGYEKFGDASGGPLQPGERGVVVDLQNGPNGERRSVRVLHNGRRWWYQPQAILSERSGLIETPGVWFLKSVLRAHAYEHTTLSPLDGEPVRGTSSSVGDVVRPKNHRKSTGQVACPCFGRIVSESACGSTGHLSSRSRDSSGIAVEFVDRAFAEATGVRGVTSSEASPVLETRRVRATKLVHASSAYVFSSKEDRDGDDGPSSDADMKPEPDDSSARGSVSDRLRAEIAALARLDRSALEFMTKECRKSPESLAGLFSAGLPVSVLSAIDVAERQMNSLETREDLPEKIALIGKLSRIIARQLFSLDPSTSASGGRLPESPETPRTDDRMPSAHRRLRLREVIARRDGRRGAENEEDDATSQGMDILQQRRNMLLTLMSSSRRGNTNWENEVFGDVAGGPPFNLGQMHHAVQNPFSLSSQNPLVQSGSWEEAVLGGGSPENAVASRTRSGSSGGEQQPSFLDSILRCRGDVSESSGTQRSSSSNQALFMRHLATSGLLTDSLPWVKASVDANAKKMQLGSVQKSSSILRDMIDEEGTPVLLLAISLGCCPEVLGYLISRGAVVSKAEIEMAAITDQASTLSLLMQHTSFPDEISQSHLSSSIQNVFARAKARQEELDRKMREEAGAFMVRLLRRLLDFCLVSRRRCSSRVELCSHAVSEILVGNVLLRSLQKTQKSGGGDNCSDEDAGHDHDDEGDKERVGRVAVDESSESGISAGGLLGSLPRDLLYDGILSDTEFTTTFLTLIEDHLCSKGMHNGAAGLALLSILLTKFPELQSCSGMRQYGLADLVSFHDALATDRMSSIVSKQSPKARDTSTATSAATATEKDSTSHVVVCPSKHTATIHITRHSSFRCDICGSGVDRGRPMHGCRECDWDACEECTDKSVSGLVKCSAIKEMSSTCLRLLSEDVISDRSDVKFGAVLESLFQTDTTQELRAISVRLLKRDLSAFTELGERLLDPGSVTVHQFIDIVIPTLHSAFLGRESSDDDSVVLRSPSGRRCKKARVVDVPEDSALDSPEERRLFCKQAIRLILTGVNEGTDSDDSEEMDSEEASDAQDNQAGDKEPKEPVLGGGGNHVKYSDAAQELLRRLHQVLAFHERVELLSSLNNDSSGKKDELQRLTTPLALTLRPSSFGCSPSTTAQDSPLHVQAEPLVPIRDLQLHILRTCNNWDQSYIEFCTQLVRDKTIIAERAVNEEESGTWRVGQIVAFNERSGSHTVRYACGLRSRKGHHAVQIGRPDGHNFDDFIFETTDETHLVLAARRYLILHRSLHHAEKCSTDSMQYDSTSSDGSSDNVNDLRSHVGKRVESNCRSDDSWSIYTLIAADCDDGCILVSDEGLVVPRVKAAQIRIPTKKIRRTESSPASRSADSRIPGWGRDDDHAALSRAFPFLSARQRTDRQREDSESPSYGLQEGSVLKRTWSASALVDKMKPVVLKVHQKNDDKAFASSCSIESNSSVQLKIEIGDSEVDFICNSSRIESPPRLTVKFSLHDKLPNGISPKNDTTLASVLKQLHQLQENGSSWLPERSIQLYFSVETDPKISGSRAKRVSFTGKPLHTDDIILSGPINGLPSYSGLESRARKLSSRSLTSEDEELPSTVCDGLDEISVQCMEVIGLLSDYSLENPVQVERDDISESLFSNTHLSKKLLEQLDDPVMVVGQALPDWCMTAPAFAPRVFSYESRKMLLERQGFGVSRSMLKQQEAKVNVGRLRQRMASLRARAVELVGEAFSGGAEDPTALQLQADELYGMEEALAARVRSAFRAVKWQEHVLEVAKVVVRRDDLLADAAAAMDQYANDPSVCRRRLEVRFDGESGFDAASGNEAGVTRGFYADVAESLLSSENVAGVYCASDCSTVPSVASVSKISPMEIDGIQQEPSKLPLWIPDMDSSGLVVIPTPRTDERSAPGVFPRPLPHYHPQMAEVLERYRFMGRLFAAAVRDGFMFPLPLSSSFLKLVQRGSDVTTPSDCAKASSASESVLTSSDLPRPGFLGGEVYAAESYICKALDVIDAIHPPLSPVELERRYKEVATDRKFARVALGKLFDYSFEDYFQDRTFVDPLDPTQGEDAVPLCQDGYRRHVTIYNVREWVALTKNFILHEGVIAQALAFREGVEDFFPADNLRLFTPEELQRDICGVGDSVDSWDDSAVRKLFKLDGGKGAAEALVAVAAIGGEGGAALSRRFAPSSPTIGFLVKALIEASPTQRRQFLSFVTSVPIVTPGRIEVVPMVSPSGDFLPMQDPGCLPRANTCARKLYLPKFETYESFSQVLWAVVREESKFKGFYEWRGS